MQVENEYLGGKKSKVWTYILVLVVLIVAVIGANFAWSNPALARESLDKVAGLPVWAFPLLTALVGLILFWLGLKIESDWPEALGAMLIAGSVAFAQILIGWSHFALGGMVVIPYVIPIVVFLVLLGIGVSRSR